MIYKNSKTVNKTVRKTVDDVVLNAIVSALKSSTKKNSWQGTMTDLKSTLKKSLDRKTARVLPKSPSHLRVVLNRIVNRLRTRSVKVEFSRSSDHMRTRFVTFTF